MVFVRIPQAQLMGTWRSSFLPGQDDWEFPNNGDYQSPEGNCEGMSATAIYYHYFYRSAPGSRPLFHQFDTHLSNHWDNAEGIHLVGAVQSDYRDLIPTMKVQQDAIRDRAAANNETAESLASTWILLNLKLVGRPLLLGLFKPGDATTPSSAHAVVAYQASGDPFRGGSKNLVDCARFRPRAGNDNSPLVGGASGHARAPDDVSATVDARSPSAGPFDPR